MNVIQKMQKMILKKIFLKLMNNVVFGKTNKNIRNIEILNLILQKEEVVI